MRIVKRDFVQCRCHRRGPKSVETARGTLSNWPLSGAHTETADFEMARMGLQGGVDWPLRDDKHSGARWSRIW
jgi:hypothetical protein